MAINEESYKAISSELAGKATLVAVSKTKPASDISDLYNLGQRDFGENYVQELVDKQAELPADIRWHFIGHLQSNKVKYIAPFVHLIHGIDSARLLQEVNKQALRNDRVIDVLLQIHIAQEETKFGLDEQELDDLIGQLSADAGAWSNVRVQGLMGMASFTEDKDKIRKEFHYLRSLADKYAQQTIPNCSFNILSMGMSSDYAIALEEGSTMVRVGSLLFGARNYDK
ncbi:MAG: YggS family pyridoxal phosphate-dependent enzyme [Chitinophagaceae bacterium]